MFKALKNWMKSTERQEIKDTLAKINESLEKLANMPAPVVQINMSDLISTDSVTASPDIVPELPSIYTTVDESKPYRNRKKIGKLLIVVANDGTIYSKEDPEGFSYSMLDTVSTSEQVKNIFEITPIEGKQEDINFDVPPEELITYEDLKLVETDKRFTVDLQGRTFFEGIKVPIPAIILAEFIRIQEQLQVANDEIMDKSLYNIMVSEKDILEDEFERFCKFWLTLVASPLTNIGDVLKFCQECNIHLSPNGNMIGYRCVLTHKLDAATPVSTELPTFIQESYDKIKGWKKSPAKYSIYSVAGKPGYKLIETSKIIKTSFEKKNYNILDNLDTLYNNNDKGVEREDLYTSSHNRGENVFTIPGIYRAKPNEIVMKGQLCSGTGGLHWAGLNSYNFSSFGEHHVVVLVNPSKATIVPTTREGKARCSEMYIVAKCPRGIHISDELLAEADEIYKEHNLQELREILKTKSFDSVTTADGFKPATSLTDIKKVVELLGNRVSKIS